jgi:hypothetical protein
MALTVTRGGGLALGVATLVLLGIAGGVAIDPWFLALSAFTGAGMAFAGLTGTCAMAQLLARMPWNRCGAAHPAISARTER